jgi:hypothetical protein
MGNFYQGPSTLSQAFTLKRSYSILCYHIIDIVSQGTHSRIPFEMSYDPGSFFFRGGGQ